MPCTALHITHSYPLSCLSLSTSPIRPGMHFWFNVKKTKHAWLVDFCLFRSSIFPESFLDSNSMDVDRHIGRIVPVPAAPPAIPISKLEKEREEKDREKEREKDGGRERERDGSNNRSPGNSLKVEDDGKYCGSIHSDSFPSFLPCFLFHLLSPCFVSSFLLHFFRRSLQRTLLLFPQLSSIFFFHFF
jgi:hypothetical protein